jgi:hypothetical protein
MVAKELKPATSDWDSGSPILVTAENEAIERIRGNSVNKPIYLIRVSGSVVSDKERVFVSDKLTETNNYLQITGVEVLNNKPKQTQKIDRNSKVLNEADSETIIDIRFPWHKINQIQNISYQHKKQTKENK